MNSEGSGHGLQTHGGLTSQWFESTFCAFFLRFFSFCQGENKISKRKRGSFFVFCFFSVRVERSARFARRAPCRLFNAFFAFFPTFSFFRPLISRSRGFEPSIPKPPERTRNNVKKRSPDVWADSLSFLRYRGKREKNRKKKVFGRESNPRPNPPIQGGVAHLVERSVRNRQAQGSKPCSSTFFSTKKFLPHDFFSCSKPK